MRTQVPFVAAFLWAAAATPPMLETSPTNYSVSYPGEPAEHHGTAKYSLRTKHDTSQNPKFQDTQCLIKIMKQLLVATAEPALIATAAHAHGTGQDYCHWNVQMGGWNCH